MQDEPHTELSVVSAQRAGDGALPSDLVSGGRDAYGSPQHSWSILHTKCKLTIFVACSSPKIKDSRFWAYCQLIWGRAERALDPDTWRAVGYDVALRDQVGQLSSSSAARPDPVVEFLSLALEEVRSTPPAPRHTVPRTRTTEEDVVLSSGTSK